MNESFPGWDGTSAAESVRKAYEWTVAEVRGQIAWYQGRKRPKANSSRILRAVAILLAGLGALCPLLDSTKLFPGSLSAYGYVFLAVGAGLVSYDRFFGLSSGWIRYTVTQMSLETALKEFQYDYLLLSIQAARQAEGNPQALLRRIREFALLVDGLVKKETDSWAAEFQRSIQEMDTLLKAEAQKRKAGSLKVIVPNAKDFDAIEIALNGAKVREMTGASECLIESVPPGRYEAALSGLKGGIPCAKVTKVIEVAADQIATLEVTLA